MTVFRVKVVVRGKAKILVDFKVMVGLMVRVGITSISV